MAGRVLGSGNSILMKVLFSASLLNLGVGETSNLTKTLSILLLTSLTSMLALGAAAGCCCCWANGPLPVEATLLMVDEPMAMLGVGAGAGAGAGVGVSEHLLGIPIQVKPVSV